MDLLVSVRSVEEARAALGGGADIIDAKDPDAGALGAVQVEILRAIRAVTPDARPVTAALGDAADEIAIERRACAFAAAGASLVKIGFAGVTSTARVTSLIRAAVRGARAGWPGSGVIAVGYGDERTANAIALDPLIASAAEGGASGVLIDTCDKRGPGLRELLPFDTLLALAARARDAGLLVAMAGRLAPADLPWISGAGADVVGVRGAACLGGRNGPVSAERVRELQEWLRAGCV